MGITITFMALWILLILSARSWYLFQLRLIIIIIIINIIIIIIIIIITIIIINVVVVVVSQEKTFFLAPEFFWTNFSLSSALSIPYMI